MTSARFPFAALVFALVSASASAQAVDPALPLSATPAGTRLRVSLPLFDGASAAGEALPAFMPFQYGRAVTLEGFGPGTLDQSRPHCYAFNDLKALAALTGDQRAALEPLLAQGFAGLTVATDGFFHAGSRTVVFQAPGLGMRMTRAVVMSFIRMNFSSEGPPLLAAVVCYDRHDREPTWGTLQSAFGDHLTVPSGTGI